MNRRYLPIAILIFYLTLSLSTILLLFQNLGRRVDGYALFFQIVIITVCLTGFFSTMFRLKFAGKFNRISLFVFSVFFGLALLNALFFGEFHLMGIREVILYLELVFIDIWILRIKLSKNKGKV